MVTLQNVAADIFRIYFFCLQNCDLVLYLIRTLFAAIHQFL
jgi:hypothetical protein